MTVPHIAAKKITCISLGIFFVPLLFLCALPCSVSGSFWQGWGLGGGAPCECFYWATLDLPSSRRKRLWRRCSCLCSTLSLSGHRRQRLTVLCRDKVYRGCRGHVISERQPSWLWKIEGTTCQQILFLRSYTEEVPSYWEHWETI